MRRSIVVLAMAVVFVLAMTSAALALPAQGKQLGKGINFHCDMSYGQLVKAAKASGHVEGPVSGVKSFIVNPDGFALHCLPE